MELLGQLKMASEMNVAPQIFSMASSGLMEKELCRRQAAKIQRDC